MATYSLSVAEWTFVLTSGVGTALAFAVYAWFYRGGGRELPMLDTVPLAYLIGGPRRAREMALFELLHDGLVKANDWGRLETASVGSAVDLPRVEGELLILLMDEGPMTPTELLSRDVPALDLVERQLERARLALTRADYALCRVLIAIPSILATTLWLMLSFYEDGNFLNHLVLVTTWVCYVGLRRKTQPRTQLGERLVESFRVATYTGPVRLQNEPLPPFLDEAFWRLKDQVLLEGFWTKSG